MTRSFRNAEIVLDAIYVAGLSWGYPWRFLMPMCSARLVNGCVLRRSSDIRPCYLRNGMRIGRRIGVGFLPGLEYVTQVVNFLEMLCTVDIWLVVH